LGYTGQIGERHRSAGAGLDRRQFGFRARTDAKFGLGGRGSGGWSGEFADGQFARRSPPRAQYGDGRGRSLELERRDGPRFSFCGFGPSLISEGRFPHNGYHGGSRFDRMDRYIDRHGRINIANPTFEEMARHWFATFGTNPSVESFARSRSWF
jgi:hypothetical protein